MLSKLRPVGDVLSLALMYMLAFSVPSLGIAWLCKLALGYEYHSLSVALWWIAVLLPVLLAPFFGYLAAYCLDAGTLVGFATGVTAVVLTLPVVFVTVGNMGVPIPPPLPGVAIVVSISVVLAFAAGGYVYGRRSRKSRQVQSEVASDQDDAADPGDAPEHNSVQ